MNTLQRMAHAALAVNGLTLPTAQTTAMACRVAPTRAPVRARPKALPAARPDRVVVLGGGGTVLVRVKDGRLPRDGEVRPDGACLRLTPPGRGGPVLLAGALQCFPAAMRWATPSEMHALDLATVRAVAPSHVAEYDGRRRLLELTIEVAAAANVPCDGSPEDVLRAVLHALKGEG